MDTQALRSGLENLQKAVRDLEGLQLPYQVGNLIAAYEMLVTRYAPLKVGQRACLVSDEGLNAVFAPGWVGCFHFIQVGAACRVEEVSVIGGKWRFLVTFEQESWMGDDKQVHYVYDPNRHWFSFGEQHLAPLVEAVE
jgi:hypothetical protein